MEIIREQVLVITDWNHLHYSSPIMTLTIWWLNILNIIYMK